MVKVIRRRARRLAVAVATGLGVLLLAEVGAVAPVSSQINAAAAAVEARRPKIDQVDPVPGKAMGKVKVPTPKINAKLARKPERRAWPKAGAAVLDVQHGQKAAKAAEARAGSLPVTVRPAERDKAKASGKDVSKVTVAVLDRKVSERAGLPGPVLAVTRADGGTKAAPVELEIDYSKFASVAGGFANRLHLIDVPACGLADPEPEKAECREYAPISGKTNNGTKKLIATVNAQSDPAGGDDSEHRQGEGDQQGERRPARFVALATDTDGPDGDFKATDLKPSATWSAGTNSGTFNWTYPLEITDMPGELSPKLEVSYDSGSVDGQTAATNNQPSWLGDGWDLATGFIEREYKSCTDDGHDAKGSEKSDLCWSGDHLQLSLPGHTGPLYKAEDGTYRIKNDDGTRIERKTGGWGNTRNGEYFVVTTTDGTKYFFGRGRRKADDPFHSLSAWHVPVFGDDAGEPCHEPEFKDSWCTQGWRWNLDYVVDTHGNSMTFFYDQEFNFYGRNRNQASTSYVRGGYLKRIEYGDRAGRETSGDGPYARVLFDVKERCFESEGVTCAPDELDDTTKGNWPDTPFDLICDSEVSCPDQFSPAFFTRKRLTKIRTQVQVGGYWEDVDEWRFNHGFPHTEDGTPSALWLTQITRVGKAPGESVTMPTIKFDGELLRGRVDTGSDDLPAMNRWRLRAVLLETGSRTTVNYATPDCDPGDIDNINPHENTTQCYPSFWTPEGADEPKRDWFHKYVVSSVIEDERVTGAPDVETRYEYLGDAAWHHDQSQVASKKTWSEWRGYQKVRTTVGARNQNRTQTETTYLRGMDEDLKEPSGGLRDVHVTPSEGDPVEDTEQLAGAVLEEKTFDGPGGQLEQSTITRPWVSAPTAGSEVRVSRMVNIGSEQTRTRRNNGTWLRTLTTTGYDSWGRPTEVSDHGSTADGADNRCTRTWYARNLDKHLIDPVKREETVTGDCADDPQRPDDVVSDERVSYDRQGYGEPPMKGDPTKTETLKSYQDGAPVYTTEKIKDFDAHGRETRSEDAAGREILTGYTPQFGEPATVKSVTNPAGQVEKTLIEPLRGKPVRTYDANDRQTNVAYDGLGRLIKVWLPGRATNQRPDTEYIYAVRQNAPTTVTTRTLRPNGNVTASINLYDGLLRKRQVQEPAPGGGRVIEDVQYDSRGEEFKAASGVYNSDPPSTALLRIADHEMPAQTLTRFDGLGRPVAEIHRENGEEKWRTTTAYDADSETVTPPKGGTPIKTITNERGDTTEIWHYTGDTPSGEHETIRYRYNKHDEIASITDNAGNEWTFGYDLRGRKTEATDPDKGTTTYTYDDLDRMTATIDARGQKISYDYDELDRKIAAYEGVANPVKRAEWRYDTLPDGTPAKGEQTGSTRYYGSHAYSSDITAVDEAGRPAQTTVTVPSAQGALAGTYEFGYTYRPDGTQESYSLPAAGGLPAETVSYAFDDLGLVENTTGLDDYVNASYYSKLGEPLQYTLARSGAADQSWLTFNYQEGTRRVDQIRLDRQTNPSPDVDQRYGYDPMGNVTSIADHADGRTERQCFSYDYLRRLNEAWAQGGIGQCADAPAKDVLGGPAPYWRSFSYDDAGNRAGEVEHDDGGDVTRSYRYPEPGQPRPHAVTSVTEEGPGGSKLNQYGYDQTGNTTSRNLAGDQQNLTWDAEGLLTKVTEDGKEASFAYDADGNRIIRSEPGTTTLYLPGGMELELDKDSGQISCTRYYTHGDDGEQAIATRQPGKLTYQVSDHHDTANSQINADDLAITQRRSLPFGNPRGEDPQDWLGDKGFVGGTKDESTGLTHLGAREYDPDIGRFISVDPVMDADDPQSLSGYGYANNNPTTNSDKEGKYCEAPGGFNPACDNTHRRSDGSTGDIQRNCDTRHASCVGENPAEMRRKTRQDIGRKILEETLKLLQHLPAKQRMNFVRAFWSSYYGDFPYDTYPEWLSITEGDLERWKTDARSAALAACQAVSACGTDALGSIHSGMIRQVGVAYGIGSGGLNIGGVKLRVGKGKSARSRCSFVSGTAVVMADGTRKPIEDVQVGDKVIATDPGTGKTSVETVVGTVDGSGTKRLVKVSVDPDDPPHLAGTGKDSLVVATGNHPFWVGDLKRWVPAGELKPGMWLRTSSGTFVQVAAVKAWTARQKVHNLTVDDTPTYHVTAGGTDVLVHNAGPASPRKGAKGVARLERELRAKGYNIVGTEMHIRANNGVRVRVDLVAEKNGKYHIYDAKNGPRAGWTKNQNRRGGYASIETSGGTFEGRNARREGLEGRQLPPGTRVNHALYGGACGMSG